MLGAAAGADGDVGEADVLRHRVADAGQKIGHATPAGHDAVHAVFFDTGGDVSRAVGVERFDEARLEGRVRWILPGEAFAPGEKLEKGFLFECVGGGDEKRAALDEGMLQTLQAAREKMGEKAILLFNPLHAASESEPEIGQRYLPAADGAMIDDFDRAANDPQKRQSREYLAATIRMMSDAARDGKIVIFKAWPGFTWWSDKDLMKQPAEAQLTAARENLTFPLACFLIGAGEHSYFNYTWGWTVDQGALAWYPEFDKPLGAPNGPATREGWTFRREFEHASVFVDVENRTAKIDCK